MPPCSRLPIPCREGVPNRLDRLFPLSSSAGPWWPRLWTHPGPRPGPIAGFALLLAWGFNWLLRPRGWQPEPFEEGSLTL
jgi:hypothetical protein